MGNVGYIAIPPTVYGYQACFLHNLVHLKGLVKSFSPCGHAQEGSIILLPEKLGSPFASLSSNINALSTGFAQWGAIHVGSLVTI